MDEVDEKQQQQIVVPIVSLSKNIVQTQIEDWMNTALEAIPPADVYVYLKQVEHAVDWALSQIKESAFNDAGTRFKGEHSGQILGHEVKLSWPKKWVYPPDVQRFERESQEQIRQQREQAKIEGTAKRKQTEGVVTVNLKQE